MTPVCLAFSNVSGGLPRYERCESHVPDEVKTEPPEGEIHETRPLLRRWQS